MPSLRTNLLKHAFATGSVAFGCSLNSVRDPGVIHVLAAAGADVVFLDLEHNCHSMQTAVDLVAHAHAAGITPLVRPPQSDIASITRLLDGGCQSLLVPRLRHPDQVEELLQWSRYHPQGRRGVAFVGGVETNYSAVDDVPAAMRWANEQLVLGLVIETAEAVEALPDMLLPGIDLVVIGSGDLAQAYGHPGQPDHPRVQAAREEARRLCAERGVAYGAFEPRRSRIHDEIALGAGLLVHGGVLSYLRRAVGEAAAEIRTGSTVGVLAAGVDRSPDVVLNARMG